MTRSQSIHPAPVILQALATHSWAELPVEKLVQELAGEPGYAPRLISACCRNPLSFSTLLTQWLDQAFFHALAHSPGMPPSSSPHSEEKPEAANKTTEEVWENTEQSNTHDILLELMMERFDRLQPYRAGMKNWMQTVKKSPLIWPFISCDLHRSMLQMLNILQPSRPLPLQSFRAKILLTIYLRSLRIWYQDESTDLAQTLRHLDQMLNQLDFIL